MPNRIQLRCAKGWRMPANAVKVDHSTRWRNPFTMDAVAEAGHRGSDAELRSMCADAFCRWMLGRFQPDLEQDRRAYILQHLGQLRDHDLACWCPLDRLCHTNVLLQLANAPIDTTEA